MSKRKRVQKVPNEVEEPQITIKGWSLEDKTKLLEALKKYGHKDIDGISTMLPNKTKPVIRIMIHKIMQKAKSLSNNRNSNLDEWLKSGLFKDESYPIPKALKFIALFENHPTPEESGGFDFKAAYEYLYRMSLGHPAGDIPEETLEKMHQLINEIRAEVSPSAESEIVHYLAKLEQKKHAMRSYPPRDWYHSFKVNQWTNEGQDPSS